MITNPNVKINLGLNVLRKREDGFHDLETLFVPYFGIYDTLEIVVGDDYSRTSAALFAKYGSNLPASQGSMKPEGVFGVEMEESVAPKLLQGISEDGKLMITIARAEGVDWDPLKDLCARAYFILAEDFQLPPVKIFLEKTSPVGAGLGGGSADAAFALKMLNELCGLGLSEADLAAYAARLGSDCAFFVYNRPMIGEGRGEILSEHAIDLSAYDLQILTPEGVAVSTKDAYAGIVRHLEAEGQIKQALEEGKALTDMHPLLINDFEQTVFPLHPEIAEIKKRLQDAGAVYAAMSGSGSTVFGLFEDDAKSCTDTQLRLLHEEFASMVIFNDTLR